MVAPKVSTRKSAMPAKSAIAAFADIVWRSDSEKSPRTAYRSNPLLIQGRRQREGDNVVFADFFQPVCLTMSANAAISDFADITDFLEQTPTLPAF